MLAELVLTSGFFLFFFGVGAIATSLLALLLTSSSIFDSFVVQSLAFLGISLLCIVLLRKPLLARFHFRNQLPPVNSLLGQSARALESILPQETGKVELHGTSWSALNIGTVIMPAGAVCRVHTIQGLTLHVRSEEKSPL